MPSPNPLLRADLRKLLLILLPCFLLLLAVRPLSVPDEGRYPEIAREMLLSGDYITPHVNGMVFLDKPALYYWLEAVSFKAFGVNLWSIRLMPALFGVLGVVMIFITAFQLFSRRAAWWAAAALACNPLYFLSSQYADMNIEVAVLVTTAICLLLLGRREEPGTKARRYLFWLAWAAIGFGVMTKGLIGLVFPAMVAGTWVLIGSRWRELRYWYFFSGLLIVLAICLPWFLAVQKQNPDFLHYFFITQQFERFSGTGFNNEFPFWFYAPVILVGLLPWSFWLPKALYNQIRCAVGKAALADADVRQLLLLWPLLILVFFSIPASKIVGYILPVLPPLALLVGEYIDRRLIHAENTGTKTFALKHVSWMPAFGVMLTLTLLALATMYDKSGSRLLADELRSRWQPGDVLISYRHYYHDLPLYLQTEKPLVVVDDWNDPAIMQTDNWQREFYLGLQKQPEARAWLVDEAAFNRQLEDNPRVFVLATKGDAEYLVQRRGLRIIARTGKHVLLAK